MHPHAELLTYVADMSKQMAVLCRTFAPHLSTILDAAHANAQHLQANAHALPGDTPASIDVVETNTSV